MLKQFDPMLPILYANLSPLKSGYSNRNGTAGAPTVFFELIHGYDAAVVWKGAHASSS
jgi:hypothetical protein